MEENKKFQKTRKVSGIILTSVLFTAALVGAGFGFAKSVDEIGGVDNRYNDFVQVEANVDTGEESIQAAADSISNTLDFLGMQNANVRTIGDSKIIINNPIDSYTYYESNIMNDDEIHFEDIMSANSNSNYFKEVGTLLIPLFFDGTLDVRDIEGDAAFVNNTDGLIQNDYSFVGGVENGGSFGVESTPDPEGEVYTYDTRETFDPDSGKYDIPNFFEKATLTHEQGLPVIELKIKKEGNNGDGYINMFKDLDRYIDSTANSDNPTQYVFWFNYQLTYDLVNIIDPDGLSSATSLYEYVASKPNLRPLYVSTGTESLMSSIYSDTVELQGTFTEKQAKYFVDKINNSSSFRYSNIQFEVIINFQTKVMLIVLASLLLLIILVVIFTFVAYFGLLGLIASAVYVVSTMTVALVISGTGILITGLGLISLGVVFAASASIMAIILNIYKSNNGDKFISVNKLAGDKMSIIQSTLFTPIVVAVIVFYGSGLVLSTAIAIPLYIIVIGVVISYLFASLLLIPILYLLDLLLEWTRREYEGKWDLTIGFNKEYIPNPNVQSPSQAKVLTGTIITIVAVALSAIIGGTLFFTTGSALNATNYGNENYVYLVEATDENAWMRLTESDTNMSGGINQFGADQVYTHYQSTSEVKGDVKDAFKNNGVKVSSIEVVRNDEVKDLGLEEGLVLLGSFGFEVNSRTELTTEKAAAVNEDLALINVELNEEFAIGTDEDGNKVFPNTSFQISERMSWDGQTSTKISGYKENVAFANSFFALMIMILVISIIITFVGNRGVGIATLISTLMEAAILLSPAFILFLPVSTLMSFIVVLLFGISLSLKTLIVKDAKNDEIEANKWVRSADRKKWVIPVFSGVLVALELPLIGIYAWTLVLPMIAVTILGTIGIFLIQQYVFPTLAFRHDHKRKVAIRAQLLKDIDSAKNPKDGEPKEEYIEGVNM